MDLKTTDNPIAKKKKKQTKGQQTMTHQTLSELYKNKLFVSYCIF